MKVTLAVLATLAVGAMAAPVAEAEPWCTRFGNPCGRKREAAPAPAPIPEPQPEAEAEAEPWCIRRGNPCGKKKREAAPEPIPEPEPVAEAEPEPIPEPQPEAEAEAEPWCIRRGNPCGKKKREAAPEPIPEPEPVAVAEPLPWCIRYGNPCGRKREAAPAPAPIPEPQPEAEAEAEPWCIRRGNPCGKKRSVFESHFEPAKRDSFEGKLKRAAYAIAQEIHTPDHLVAREPSPEALISNLPGGVSYNAKRGISELASMISLTSRDAGAVFDEFQLKRNLGPDTDESMIKREALPNDWREVDKRSCGDACNKAKRAAEAVLHVIGDTHEFKREAEADPWCIRRGNPCGKKKREVLSIAHAARDLLQSLES